MRKRRYLLAILAVVAAFTVSAEACDPPGMRALPEPFYGVTFDNDSFASQSKLAAQATALDSLDTPNLPFLRIVLDEGVQPDDYTAAVDGLHDDAYLMGELLDSSALKQISVEAYRQRTIDYLAAFPTKMDVWEVGNEIGGSWAGSNVSQAEKIAAAFDQVEAAGKRSALTLWYNVGCEDGDELTPLEFTDQHVPARMKTGLDYVYASYYETQCGNRRPSEAQWRTFYQALHARYPNAQLGFGEIGLPRPTKAGTLAKAKSIATYYYGLDLFDLPYYVGGHYWWYAAQDLVPWPDLMGATLETAMDGY